MKSKICHLLYLRCFFRMIWRLSYMARNWPMFWKETRCSCMLFFFGSLWSFPVIENTVWWVTKDCVLPILYILLSTFDFQPGRIRAVGIVGIERKLEEKRKETDKNISEVTLTEVLVICLFQPFVFILLDKTD